MNALPVWRKLRGYGIITMERCHYVRAARALANGGCSLWEMARTADTVTFAVSHRGMACLAREAQRHPLPMKIRPGGRDAWIAALKRRPVSLCFAVLIVGAVLLSTCFYWRVDLSGIPVDCRDRVSVVMTEEMGELPVLRGKVDRRNLRDRILLGVEEFTWRRSIPMGSACARRR